MRNTLHMLSAGYLVTGLMVVSVACQKTVQVTEDENSAAQCSDNQDNDEDGLTDCADVDCQSFAVCRFDSDFDTDSSTGSSDDTNTGWSTDSLPDTIFQNETEETTDEGTDSIIDTGMTTDTHTDTITDTATGEDSETGSIVDTGDDTDTNTDSATDTTPVEIPYPVAVVSGAQHSCVLLNNGAVRCFGFGALGQLGYGNTDVVGNDEYPYTAGDVPIGGKATHIAAGKSHTCAIVAGQVACWGDGEFGQLGYGNTDNVGDDELPSHAGFISLGGTAVAITAGDYHTCALLDQGKVKCWGRGQGGVLGYGGIENIGDNEIPAEIDGIDVGGTVTQIAAGTVHTCALLDTGDVVCWGAGFMGRLGYGNTEHIGDDETPASAGTVSVGGTVVQISVGGNHSCALLDTGKVRCWGAGAGGALGYGNIENIGDNEVPSAAGDVDLSSTVTRVETSWLNTCVTMTNGWVNDVTCWGETLACRGSEPIGDDEPASESCPVAFGGGGGDGDSPGYLDHVSSLSVGEQFACAVSTRDGVAMEKLWCWGDASNGQLGSWYDRDQWAVTVPVAIVHAF